MHANEAIEIHLKKLAMEVGALFQTKVHVLVSTESFHDRMITKVHILVSMESFHERVIK